MKKLILCSFFTGLFFSSVAQVPTFTVTNPSAATVLTCYTPSISLSAGPTGTTGILTFSWSNGISNFTGTTVIIGSPGTYTVTGTNSLSVSNSTMITIGINNSPPTFTLSPLSQTVDCNSFALKTVSATSNPSNNVIHSFSSNLGTYTSSAATAMFVPFTYSSGSYSYNLLNTINGCSATANFFVTFMPSSFPTFLLNSAQNFTLGCGSKSIATATISNLVGPTYTILPPGIGSNYTVASTTSFSVSAPGSQTIMMYSNATGCELKFVQSFLLNNSPPQLTVVVPTQTLTCSNPITTLQAQSQTPNVNLAWFYPSVVWMPSSSVIVSVNTFSSSATLLATYTIVATDNNNGCKTSSVVQMYQDISPPPMGTSSLFVLNCPQPALNIFPTFSTAINNSTLFSFSWSTPGGSTVQASLNPTLQITSEGVYTVTIKNIENGCLATTTIGVAGCVSLKKLTDENITVIPFPNPSSGIFLFNGLAQKERLVLELYNSIGALVSVQTFKEVDGILDISEIPAGIYYLRLYRENSEFSYVRLLKE